MAEKEIPWWAKTIVYIGIPVGVLVAAYKLISDWLMGPTNAVKELWEKQYNDYVDELKRYAEEDGGALTSEHQTILAEKLKVIRQTEQTFIQVSGRLDYWIGVITAGVFIIAALYFLPAIISKWKGIVKKGNVQSEIGQGYVAMCMAADDLAARGMVTQASALSRVIITRFQTIDKPFMESQIAYWQSQLPNLVGWQLLYAQYVISAYQTTLATVPIWFTYIPPPLLI